MKQTTQTKIVNLYGTTADTGLLTTKTKIDYIMKEDLIGNIVIVPKTEEGRKELKKFFEACRGDQNWAVTIWINKKYQGFVFIQTWHKKKKIKPVQS